jgi:hypothetical protein
MNKSDNIIVGFKGCMLTGIGFKFIYLKDERNKPVKRKPGNPSPRIHSLKFGKHKK